MLCAILVYLIIFNKSAKLSHIWFIWLVSSYACHIFSLRYRKQDSMWRYGKPFLLINPEAMNHE